MSKPKTYPDDGRDLMPELARCIAFVADLGSPTALAVIAKAVAALPRQKQLAIIAGDYAPLEASRKAMQLASK